MNIKLSVPAVALAGLLLGVAAHAEDPDFVIGTGDPFGKNPAKVPGSVPRVERPVDYQVAALLPKVPVSLPTYQVQQLDPTAIDPRREPVAWAFDFHAKTRGVDKSEDGGVSMLLTDADQRSIEYFSSGAVFYMEEELFSERTDDILARQKLDRDTAARLYAGNAQEFLDKHGLTREGMYLKDVSFTEVKSMGYKDQVETVKTVGAAAHYGYRIDGIPAWGAGAKTTVYFGADGISGFYDALPDLAPGKAVPLRSPDEALQAYMDRKAPASLYRLHAGAVDQVVIEKVELVYHVDAGNSNQQVVAPYYLIQGSFHGTDVSAEKGGDIKSEFIWMEPAAI